MAEKTVLGDLHKTRISKSMSLRMKEEDQRKKRSEGAKRMWKRRKANIQPISMAF